MTGRPVADMIGNHFDRAVRLVRGRCDKCGPSGEERAVRVYDGARQCGHCGWLQGGWPKD